MTTASHVPATLDMDGSELDAEDAYHVVRRVGVVRLLVDAFRRFRYGDGFSNSRALGLQVSLALVPFLIALTGLSVEIDADNLAQVVAVTAESLAPGGAGSGLTPSSADGAGELALVGGLAFSFGTMTTALAQIERGANRIYGIRRDRPFHRKYLRALVLMLTGGLLAGLGFLAMVAGGSMIAALGDAYGLSESLLSALYVVRWPLGVLTTVLAVAIILDHSPRRHQPALSWLAFGGSVTVLGTLAITGGLALYVTRASDYGAIYGPLAGIMVTLLWAQLVAMAFFYGTAVAAQLEAVRAGVTSPVDDDPELRRGAGTGRAAGGPAALG